MNEDNYLKESVIKCVDYAMEQDDDTKRRIFTGLFEYTDRLVNEDIVVKTLNDKEKKEWFNNEIFNIKDKEIERLNNIINELEKFLKISSEKDDYDLTEYNKGVNNAYNYTLDKLKELKEK